MKQNRDWGIVLIIIAGLCIIFISIELGNWHNFIVRPGTQFSDLTITYWPNLNYIKQSIQDYGQIPLWRTLIFSGSPLDPDPQSGIWYWPNIFILILPTTLGINFLILIHLILAGMGMYSWVRMAGMSWQAGLLSGITYTLSPKVLAHLGFGHLGLVYASAFIPWVMLSSLNMAKGRLPYAGLFGLALGMQFIAHPQLAFYTAVAAGIYFLSNIISTVVNKQTTILNIGVSFRNGILAVVLAVLVMSVQLFPLLKFSQFSSRQELTIADTAVASLPPQYFLGMFLADYQGFMDYMTYVGIPVIILALLTIQKRHLLWWFFILSSWIYALGINTPVYAWFYEFVPGIEWLRAPTRILFITNGVLIFLAAMGFNKIQNPMSVTIRRNYRLFIFTFGSLSLFTPVGYFMMYGASPRNLLIFGLIGVATSITIFTILVNRAANIYGMAILGGIIILDLWIINGSLVDGIPEQEVLQKNFAVKYLSGLDEPLPYRVFSIDYSVPRQVGALLNLESADGIDPLFTSYYDRYIQAATGIGRNRYGVTVPAMGGDIEGLNDNFSGSSLRADLLGALNVKYLVAKTEIQNQGFELTVSGDGYFVYQNTAFLPRTYFANQITKVKSPNEGLRSFLQNGDPRSAFVEGVESVIFISEGEVELASYTPNRQIYTFSAENETFLIISQAYYPGWKARIGQLNVPIYRVNGTLMGIYLPPGSHRISLVYQPSHIFWTVPLAILGWIVCLVMIMQRTKHSNSQSEILLESPLIGQYS